MVCTFFHPTLRDCMVSYCYYPRSEIDCPVKKEHIEKVGDFYRESPDSKPLINQAQPRRYPKQY